MYYNHNQSFNRAYNYNQNNSYKPKYKNTYNNNRKFNRIIKPILIVMVIIVVVIGIVAYINAPVLKAMHILSKSDNLEQFNYTAQVHIKSSTLDEQTLELLSQIIQIDQNGDITLMITGSFNEGNAYAQLYCKGIEGAVTECYIEGIGEEVDGVINVEMLYAHVKNYISENYGLISLVVPGWKYNNYMTLDQISEITGINIKEMLNSDNAKNDIINNENNDLYKDLFEMESTEKEDGSIELKSRIEKYDITLNVSEVEATANLNNNNDSQKDKVPQITCTGTPITSEDAVNGFQANIQFVEIQPIVTPTQVMLDEEIAEVKNLIETVRGFME